jgi:putative transposase
MVEAVFSRNCVYQTAYHVVWCPKYRRSILTGEVARTLDALLGEICSDRGFVVLSKEIQPDHVHLFLSFPPSHSIADVVRLLKGATARKLFVAHPELKDALWDGHLWSPSYYVGTAGNVSAETIRKYIERTEHIKGRR